MTTFSRINFDKMFGTVAPDTNNPNLQTAHGIASFIYTDLVNNGFKVIYPTGTFDLYNQTEVVFEAQGPTGNPTKNVDPLGDSQAWRIGFKTKGYQNNELWCYAGTSSTMGDGTNNTPTGVDEFNSVAMILVQGGSAANLTRISPSNLYSYTLTITPRGMSLVVYENLYIEDMRRMGMVIIQRPVKSDGSVLQTGYCPVFCLHNTNPDKAGRPQIEDRFYFHVVREQDKLMPTQPDLISEQGQRQATATYTFFQWEGRDVDGINNGRDQDLDYCDGARIEFEFFNLDVSPNPYKVIFYDRVGAYVQCKTTTVDCRFFAQSNDGTHPVPGALPLNLWDTSGTPGTNIPIDTDDPVVSGKRSLTLTDCTIISGLNGNSTSNAFILASTLSNIKDARVTGPQGCSFMADNTNGNMYITANTAGAEGNKMYFRTKAYGNQVAAVKITGLEWYAPWYHQNAVPINRASPTTVISNGPAAGTYGGVWGDANHPSFNNDSTYPTSTLGSNGCIHLSGGGDAITVPTGWFEIDRVPGNNDSITINQRAIKFRTQASIDSGLVLDPANEVLVGSTQLTTAQNLFAWIQNNSSFEPKLRIADFNLDIYAAPPLNARITVKLKTILDDTQGTTFDITANTPAVPNAITYSKRPDGTGGLSVTVLNQAYGYIWFTSNPTGNEILSLNGINFQFLNQYANPLYWQVQINPTDLHNASNSTLGNLMKILTTTNNTHLNVAKYTMYTASADISAMIVEAQKGGFRMQANSSNIQAVIKVLYATPGIDGNRYTMALIMGDAFTVSGATLLDGNGYFTGLTSFTFNTEVSDPLSSYGTAMYQVPKSWVSPVTTDRGEYVLVFPFGFTSPRVAYIEEMDLIAFSKGAAYQGVQPISISVYGQTRTYTSLCSNLATQPNYVRVFVLTSGGGV